MKKINFIPGFPEKPSNHKALSKYLNVLNIDWNKPKLNFKNKKLEVLTAFSFGGIIALEYALRKKVGTLVLCSLTPGIESLNKVKADNIIFIVGEKEEWVLQNVKRLAKTLKCNKKIIVVKGAGHKIVGEYKKELLKVLASI